MLGAPKPRILTYGYSEFSSCSEVIMAAKSVKSGQSGELSLKRSMRPRLSLFWFAATTLLGAFLVFQVQPVISKCVLPWFGGTPAVWTTCMLFFQVLLFAGYLYAHLLRSLFRPPTQAAIHLTLLAAAAWALPIEPSDAWKPQGDETPTLYLLWLLTAHVGLPYFVLSSTGPLVQAWLSYHDDSHRVYRLYALSNAGSLGALLSYPFLVEPALSVSSQSIAWSLMFCGFVLVQGTVAISLLRISEDRSQPGQDELAHASEEHVAKPTLVVRSTWLALPALASTMLLVVTNHVCQDVAVIPFLWVLPLSLYLLSFIICFDSPQWYQPKWISAWTLVAIVAIQGKAFLPASTQLVGEVIAYMLMLLGVCLLCHGEVARLKPAPAYLTQFYLLLSAGGAIGGVLVAIVCPFIFNGYGELPLTIAVVSALALMVFFACRGWRSCQYDWQAAYRLRFGAAGLLVAPLLAMWLTPQDETIASERNFFGVLTVLRDSQGTRLIHGSTIHGMQLKGEDSQEPTTYYGRDSGVGLAITTLQREKPSLKFGVVGLGCGVLATYGRQRDRFDMFEINPAVVQIANEYFSFLRESDAQIVSHVGDGRLVLERMTSAKFDLLVLDAFSSDAIPAHLLTREAISLYRARLRPDGVMAIHLSNNHLDLVPLAHRLSHDAGMESRLVISPGDADRGLSQAAWMLVTDKGHPLWNAPELAGARRATPDDLANAPLWTDQHHNLVSVLKLW